MRGQIEKECLSKVKEFFFCYKERNLEMMLSNSYYELKDDNLLDNISLYIQSRRNSFCGMKFEDIKEVFLAIRDAKEKAYLYGKGKDNQQFSIQQRKEMEMKFHHYKGRAEALRKEYVDFCHENNRVEYRSRLRI
jgi:hypothetical protein